MTFNIGRLPTLLANLLAVASALLLVSCAKSEPVRGDAKAVDAQHLVAIYQYLASDYPLAVASGDAGELAEQRSLSGEAVSLANRLGNGALAVRAASIDARVRDGRDAAGVREDCGSLVDDVIAAAGLTRAPSAPPDLDEGARLFQQTCATCHGPTGRGDGPAAASLNPRPASFHSPELMGGLTPFKAFNAIRFGVNGTAMAPFDSLDEKRRWALAFFVFSLRQPDCNHPPPRVSLDDLANLTDDELSKRIGSADIACARRKLPELDGAAMIAAAQKRVEEGARMAKRGDPHGAEKLILDAYLTDIEPIEPWLRARDARAVANLESAFTAVRAALQQERPNAADDASRLAMLLGRAMSTRNTSTRVSVFWFSLLVIVREGFEAAVIIAALLAVLKKRKQIERARWVHAGWMSALGVGAVSFLLGRKVLAGAMNEKIEGVLAIVAVVMLVHAALWLNARSTTRKTMGALRERAIGALDRGALSLFAIAFLAMFRETFETAVFLEALSLDAPASVAWGAAFGAVLLFALVFGVGRLGLRLPMRALFKVSTVVLMVTAVMLLGQGIHSFEEVGLLPSLPIPFFQVDFLGIYPDRISVMAQVGLAALPLLWMRLFRRPMAGRGGFEPAS